MKHEEKHFDVVVCGGGLAGLSAAVAAARAGISVCLVQDRPVLGGNSSSEVRVTPHGAANFHAYGRETGIISELLIEERARNHETITENGWTNSVWDLVMYDLATRTPGLTLMVNTSLTDVVLDDGSRGLRDRAGTEQMVMSMGYTHRKACNSSRRIRAIEATVANAELHLSITGKLFIDCTGDGVLAHLAGCEWRMGSESRSEFGEVHAPADASQDVMGNSIHFKTRNLGFPVPFQAPDWAVKHDDPSYFYDQGRVPRTVESGYWWIEVGVPWHTIHEAEDIRHELTRHCLGIWDWIKNKDPRLKERAANYALDWIGQVPGKRESRRIIGRRFMTENDIQSQRVFDDEIAYGGWFVDLHTPGGLLAPTSEPNSAEGYVNDTSYMVKSYVTPYSIPLGICIAKDHDNLMMAGRNVSVSHAALGTVRVMATTALLGQACGTAAARSVCEGRPLYDIADKRAGVIQQDLLRSGCFLPHVLNQDPADLARAATITASSDATCTGVELADGSDGEAQPQDHTGRYHDRLTHDRGQWIALGGGRLDSVSVCLTNPTAEPQDLRCRLETVSGIWDYRASTGEALRTATLHVPPGERQWVDWPVKLKRRDGLPELGFIRLTLERHDHLEWHPGRGVEPGQVAAFHMRDNRLRRYAGGVSMAFRVSPPQKAFPASNVASGVTRPREQTHLWRSDPAKKLPQFIRLVWDEPQDISRVDLTFPGHLLKEYHATPPLHHDPQCARDYTIEVSADGDTWNQVAAVSGNYQRHRVHTLESPVRGKQLRVTLEATHGHPSAGLYEVRVY